MPDGDTKIKRMPPPVVRRPEAGFSIPSDERGMTKKVTDIIEECRASSGIRAAYARQLNAIIETGRQDGTRSLINKLWRHCDRVAAYLYSADNLRFTIDFTNRYPELIGQRAEVTARILGLDFEETSADLLFGDAVTDAVHYGASIFKQWVETEGQNRIPVYRANVIMPWLFSVYNESINDIHLQPALCETTLLTLPEVWRRIWDLPDAEAKMRRIRDASAKGQSGDEYNSFFHQVLSTSTLGTGEQGMTYPVPGGIVQLNNDPNYAIVGPTLDVPLVRMHELWIWGREDWETYQLIEPDILIFPTVRRGNILKVDGRHPYTLVQPVHQNGYFWGRPEITDLIEPQGLLSTWSEDSKRMMGLQIDKILAFTGDGLTEEQYAQMRAAGFLNLGPGTTVNDVTPQMPTQLLPMIEFLMNTIDQLGGFSNILSGEGTPGVRAGNHAQTLLRTASPTLKRNSLRIERQLAQAADLRLSMMQAKDGRTYWTHGDTIQQTGDSSFLLTDLPDDRRVVVDSHSSSPIFQNDQAGLIGAALKEGVVGPEYAIDNLPFPHKETAQRELRKRQAAQKQVIAKLEQEDPSAAAKVLAKK